MKSFSSFNAYQKHLKKCQKEASTIFKVSAKYIARPLHETREERVPTDSSQ